MVEVVKEAEKALEASEVTLLEQCEQTIQQGLQTFREVGQALLTIRDKKLYRSSHRTFEAYCRERWSMARSTAYQLLNAAEVVGNLSAIADKTDIPLPETESQARELAKLEPEQQAEAWQEAVIRSDGKPTAAQVREVVEEMQGPPEPPPLLRNPTQHAPAPPEEDDEPQSGQADNQPFGRGFENDDTDFDPESAHEPPAGEPQQMSLLNADSVPLSAALAESYGTPKPAAPFITFSTEADFLKAARAVANKERKEQSENDEHISPDELLDALRAEGYRFTLDVAATAENAKAPRFFTKVDNALIQSWEQRPELDDDGDGWQNHPYTLTIEFMTKAFQTAMFGQRTMVCLPKNDTEQVWAWNLARFGEVRLLPRRIAFSGGKTTGRFGNMIVIFSKDMAKPGYRPSIKWWDWRGDWNAELPLASGPAVKQGVLLGDRVFFQQPADFEQADSPLIWTPYRAPEPKKRKAG